MRRQMLQYLLNTLIALNWSFRILMSEFDKVIKFGIGLYQMLGVVNVRCIADHYMFPSCHPE